MPCIMQTTSVFPYLSHGLGPLRPKDKVMAHRLCAGTNTRVIVAKNMCLALAREWDRASATEIVWATSARGVWGLANVFADGKLCLTRGVPGADLLPLGLEPPVKPAPKAAKPRAKPAPKSAAKPAAGEPIPVAPVERVQLFRVKCSRHKRWHPESVSQCS